MRTAAGDGISGTTVTANNGGGSDTTGISGYYELTVPYKWKGSITPGKSDYSFTPSSKSISGPVIDDQEEVDFTGYGIPPDNVSGFTAMPGDMEALLRWDNPADTDFSGVRVVRKTGGYPANRDDGTTVYNGSGTEVLDTALSNGSTYYYRAFSYDTDGFHASGESASARPFNIPTHYVSKTGSDIWPYDSSSKAARGMQSAFDAAGDNDTVLIADGTYYVTNTIYVTKNTHIRSRHGHGSTVLDGMSLNRIFLVSRSVVSFEGLAFTHGYSHAGSTIGGTGGSITVSNCVFIDNHSDGNGGAVRGNDFEKFEIRSCRFLDNSSEGPQGGGAGVFQGGASVIIEDSYFQNNTAAADGGAINIWNCEHVDVSGCRFEENRSSVNGGGIYLYPGSDSSNAIYNSRLIANAASNGNGGGVYFDARPGSSNTVHNSYLVSNVASNGGALFFAQQDALIHNCLVVSNIALADGGGVFFPSDSGSTGGMYNCTVCGNLAVRNGGGSFRVPLFNSILSGNHAAHGADVFGASVYYTCASSLEDGVNGNRNDAPQFVDAVNGDYRLASTSLCIDWGNDAYALNMLDLAGNPRKVGPRIDMGCYEYQTAASREDSDGDGLVERWEWAYFNGNASADRDEDADGQNNRAEAIAGMNPTNPASYFAITNAGASSGFILEWPSVKGRWYKVLWTPGLTNRFQLLEDFITHSQNSYTDTTHEAESAGFYKVEVRMK